ncbi:MAG: inositol oxygenase family protein, partial [Planctomycetota bacterium]
VGLGYQYGHRVDAPRKPSASERDTSSGLAKAFRTQALEIDKRQQQQTKETVQALKAKYESPILGKFRVWELLQQLAVCIDPTDTSLYCTSQYMHVCQIVAAMEEDGELDETMLLVALLHDLGKIAMLEGEPPEHVVCHISPIEALEPGAGLEKVTFQFGHDEIAYSRFKDHVPEDVAWALRYHSTVLGKSEPYMNARDHEYEKRILTTFRKYDQGTKSPANLPAHTTLDRFRDFVESYFPNPILF